MKSRVLIILGMVLFFSIILMLLTYPQFEANQKNNLKWSVGEYDGIASKMVLMISEQCLDKEENPFKDYAFARTSNGEYYIDNVICERINVHQGGCLEPFSKGYPDENCKNRVTFDFPYGEKGTPINKEFCNQVESERSPDDSEHNKIMIDEYVNICTIRGLIDIEPEHDAEMIEKIKSVSERSCRQMNVIPEWIEITDYTKAYDKRYTECRMIEIHEEPQLVKLDGNRYHIGLELNNAKVIDSKFSKNSNSLILNLDTINDGVISITIPRDLYNYPEEIPRGIPVILQNGEEIEYVDSSNDINFITQFNFTHPNPTIEILGTFYP